MRYEVSNWEFKTCPGFGAYMGQYHDPRCPIFEKKPLVAEDAARDNDSHDSHHTGESEGPRTCA